MPTFIIKVVQTHKVFATSIGQAIDSLDKINGQQVISAKLESTNDVLMQLLLLDIVSAAQNGRPFTETGDTGVYKRREELDERLRVISRDQIEEMVQELLKEKKIYRCITSGSRFPKWLDIKGGPYCGPYWAGIR